MNEKLGYKIDRKGKLERKSVRASVKDSMQCRAERFCEKLSEMFRSVFHLRRHSPPPPVVVN
jgi:hypothetical protein